MFAVHRPRWTAALVLILATVFAASIAFAKVVRNTIGEVQASTSGKPRFEEGPATAVAVGRTTHRGEPTDAHQWLVEITLVGE